MEEISVVGIVGAGTMGRRIGFACAAAGLEVRLFDINENQTRSACEQIVAWSGDKLVSSPSRPIVANSLASCIDGAGIAIENVPERVEFKRSVFAQLDQAARPQTILASNTSAIPGSWFADATSRPEMVINMNFGHLEDRKVEVMGHPRTSDNTIARTLDFLKSIGMVPILVQQENLGYSTNRIWHAVKKEVLRQLENGISTPENIDRGWMHDWGTSIGPCGLMDKVGLDVVRDIETVYFSASGDESDRPTAMLEDLITNGHLGEKTGQGFYIYPNPDFERPGFLDGETDE